MMTQIKRNDPIGDLARDIRDDARINQVGLKAPAEWREHINAQTGSPAVKKALRNAIKEYELGGLLNE
jgi:hypothetical protein